MFKKALLAIDVGSSSVKLSEVSGSGKKKSLKFLGLEMIPEGTVVNGEIIEKNTLKQAIIKLLRDLKISHRNRRVALALSGQAIVVKRMTLVPDENSDLSEQIYEEAKQQFHHDMNDMYFRFEPINSQYVQKPEQAFLAVAGKIDIVEQYVDLINELEMKVGVIDVEYFCLANCFQHNYPTDKTLSVIINIGANTTQIVILKGDEYYYSRDIQLGGNHITRCISEDLSIDFESAESLKISASDGDQTVAEKIKPSVSKINQDICQEVAQTLHFFSQSEDTNNRVEQQNVYVTGGAAMSLELAASLSTLLETPIQVLNPFNNIDTHPSGIETDYILSHGSIYSVVSGLSLRKIDD